MEITLYAKPPFSFTNLVRSHGWVQLLPFESEEPYNCLTYILELSSGKVCEVTMQGITDGVSVAVDGQLSAEERQELKEKAAWMLDLELELTDFYDLVRDEPKLAHAAKDGRGRILRCATVFEDVVKTVLTTNTAWSGTKRMAQALVEKYGARLPADPNRKAFPTPERLADGDGQALREQAKLGYRSPYILELAQRQASGELDLEALKGSDLPTPELRKQLLSLKGVGDYAAANLLMLLGRYDYIPVDSWALMMVSREWYHGEPITRVEVEAAFERWGDWQGLAFWLWDWNE